MIVVLPNSEFSFFGSYIADMRHEEHMYSSWGYFLSNITIVINFILHLAPHQLDAAASSANTYLLAHISLSFLFMSTSYATALNLRTFSSF